MSDAVTFTDLARRDSELAALAVRGRRRTLVLMVLASAAIVALNAMINAPGALGVMPVVLGCLGGISYSWSKWRRHPEDTQVIAFVGLSRNQRREAYRSLRRSTPVADPVVLTILEAMHDHAERTTWIGVATIGAIAVSAVGLFVGSGDHNAAVLGSVAVTLVAVLAIGAQFWVTKRAGRVVRLTA